MKITIRTDYWYLALSFGRLGTEDRPPVTVSGKYAVLRARDGDDCWICGKVINFALKDGSSWAPSRDHVVRKRDGGTDELSNLRLAHVLCNSQRN